jgi:hypothetical protein
MRSRLTRPQADRRFLPFALRALIIACPARVDIRARNPCLRARFRRLGWKVRFISLVLKIDSYSGLSFCTRRSGFFCEWPTKEGNCNFFAFLEQGFPMVSLFCWSFIHSRLDLAVQGRPYFSPAKKKTIC